MAVFRQKVHFVTATKFLCVKTISDKVVRHSLAVQKMIPGDVPFYT